MPKKVRGSPCPQKVVRWLGWAYLWIWVPSKLQIKINATREQSAQGV